MAIGNMDIVRVTAQMRSDLSGILQNVYHIRMGDPGAIPQADIRADIGEWLEDIYTPLLLSTADNLVFDEIQLFNVTDDVPEPTTSWPSLLTGSGATEVLPDAVSGLILFRTGVSRVIGKKYYGAFGEDTQADGEMVVGTMTALANAAGPMLATFIGLNGTTFEPVIWSRLTSLARVPVEAVVRSVPAYQRRRKRGVGV